MAGGGGGDVFWQNIAEERECHRIWLITGQLKIKKYSKEIIIGV